VRRWNPGGKDIVAIILALGVSLTLSGIVVAEIFPPAGGKAANHISDEEAAALATALGAVVGALATYLGVRENRRRKNGDEDHDHKD
jgi:outer membrane lipoprotein SlyB